MLINTNFAKIMTAGFGIEQVTLLANLFPISYQALFSEGDFAFLELSDGNRIEVVRIVYTQGGFTMERGYNGSTIVDYTNIPICITNSNAAEALTSDCNYQALPDGVVPTIVVSNNGVCQTVTIDVLRTLLGLDAPVVTPPAADVDLCVLINQLVEANEIQAGDKSIITRNGACFLIDEGNRCVGQNQV